MDVLNGNLEAVEAAGLGDLDLVGEVQREVLVDDAVRGREEGEDVRDEEALLVVELLPVALCGWVVCGGVLGGVLGGWWAGLHKGPAGEHTTHKTRH